MRSTPVMAAFAALSLFFGQAAGQSDAVDILLEHSEAAGVLAGFRPSFEQHFAQFGIDLSGEVGQILERELAVEALLPLMRDAFVSQGEPRLFEEAAELVERGAIGRVQKFVDTLDFPMALGEYVEGVNANPPPEARLQLVGQIAQQQAAGEFLLLLSESQREAATLLAATISSAVPPFEPLPKEQRAELTQQYLVTAFYSFLQRYEAVDDAELRLVLSEWQSEAGSFFVRAYSLAMADTAYLAAERILAELEG